MKFWARLLLSGSPNITGIHSPEEFLRAVMLDYLMNCFYMIKTGGEVLS